jgi:cell wall-associated NlpC family hydrolase
LVLSAIGVSIARDTGMQVKSQWLHEINLNEAKQGDLVFFAENKQINHVGFSLGEGKIIHCSGEVKIESINEGDAGFNQYLSRSIFKTCSISDKVAG